MVAIGNQVMYHLYLDGKKLYCIAKLMHLRVLAPVKRPRDVEAESGHQRSQVIRKSKAKTDIRSEIQIRRSYITRPGLELRDK